MIAFDFSRFEVQERISRTILSKKTGINKTTVVEFWKRGTIKPETLQLMEKKLKKDLSQFITKPKKKGTGYGKKKRRTAKASR